MVLPGLSEMCGIVYKKKLTKISAAEIERFMQLANKLPLYAQTFEDCWLQENCVIRDDQFGSLCLGASEWFVSTSSCDLTPESFPFYRPEQCVALFVALKAKVKIHILVADSEPAKRATVTLFDMVRRSGAKGFLQARVVPHEEVVAIGGLDPNFFAAFDLLTLTHETAAQLGCHTVMFVSYHVATQIYDEDMIRQPSGNMWVRTRCEFLTDPLSVTSKLRNRLKRLRIYRKIAKK